MTIYIPEDPNKNFSWRESYQQPYDIEKMMRKILDFDSEDVELRFGEKEDKPESTVKVSRLLVLNFGAMYLREVIRRNLRDRMFKPQKLELDDVAEDIKNATAEDLNDAVA
jgi:hypothetical protein